MRGVPPTNPNTNNPNQIANNPLPTALFSSASCSPSYNALPEPRSVRSFAPCAGVCRLLSVYPSRLLQSCGLLYLSDRMTQSAVSQAASKADIDCRFPPAATLAKPRLARCFVSDARPL